MSRSFQAPVLPAAPRADDWDFFYRQFSNYLTIVEAKDEQKLPLFLNSLGRDGLLLYDGLPNPKSTYKETIERFQTYYTGRTSVLLRRKQFYEARQSAHETVSTFAVRLRRLAQQCDFGDTASTLLRDIFVVGVHDDRLGERLLAEKAADLTFDNALGKAEAFERARVERGAVASAAADINNVSHNEQVRKGARRSEQEATTRADICKCYRCGSIQHKANYEQCPARRKKCLLCLKIGHFKSCCKSKSQEKQLQVNNIQQGIEQFDLFTCNEQDCDSSNLDSLSRYIYINDTPVFALIDSGSQLNVLPVAAVPNLKLDASSTKIFAWGDFPVSVIGEVVAKVAYKNKTVEAKFHVVDSKVPSSRSRALMSFNLCKDLGLIDELAEVCVVESTDCAEPMKTKESNIREEFDDLFHGIGRLTTGDKYTISLSADAKPYSPPARRLPPAIIPKVKVELERMVADEIIRPIDEPTKFCSPMVVAYRKSGQVRIVADLRRLNSNVNREEFQIPTLDELAFKAKGSTIFSKLDLKSGFWQIPIDESSEKFLAFSTPVGRFCYRKLPMGLSASPEFFARF